MSQGQSIYRLQNLDQELERGQRRIAEIQVSFGETESLRQARAVVADAEKEYRKWMTEARDLELELESLSNKISASENRLYSGSITNPKELSDIQAEVASLNRRRRELEDKLLEAMVYSEEAESMLKMRDETLSATKNRWQADQEALQQELDELNAQLQVTQDERDRLRQRIAPDELALYDSVRARLGSVAVATLRDGVCGFCAVAPSSTKFGRIRSGRELQKCSNCGRILLDL
jgi:predicted  nucleic acid-binding Zn-ribbon protein